MSLTTQDVDFLRGLVARHSGNVIVPRQLPMLEQRLTPIAEGKGLRTAGDLVAELRHGQDHTLSVQVAEAVTVNETSFFRDRHLFDALKETILPEIVERRKHERRIRIWCAACSSGQEPLSVAMVIRDAFPQLSAWDIRITATDICEIMLQRSVVGEYTQLETSRGLPGRFLSRFFTRIGNVFRACQDLRSMIDYQRMNLAGVWPSMGHFDIVLLRNVLIYFDQQAKSGILMRVNDVLDPEGYLFIGSAEMLIGLGAPFTRQEFNGTVSYRPGKR